jgi:hypothetical protein
VVQASTISWLHMSETMSAKEMVDACTTHEKGALPGMRLTFLIDKDKDNNAAGVHH